VPHNVFMPKDLKVSTRLPRAQQEAEIKRMVSEFIRANLEADSAGSIVLYMDSDPVYYDPDGEWRLDVQTTVEAADGTLRTRAVLDRPLGATPLLPADMLMPEGLCKQAFEDNKGECVAVQLAALLKLPLEQVRCEIDALWRKHYPPTKVDDNPYLFDGQLESWRTVGVDSHLVGAFATRRGMNCYVVSRGQKVMEFRAPVNKKKGCIAFAVDGDHAWFYE